MDAKLRSGSRIAVVGGGPAGSLFSFFLQNMAAKADISLHLDIYEPKQFSAFGPAGCNMCGGIISESLVQLLAFEGISLPATVVQRGIDSYIMHTDVGRIKIDPPGHEKRIAAIHRGGGPRGSIHAQWESFDGYLLGLATERGAVTRQTRVEGIEWIGGKPCLKTVEGLSEPYDLVTVASGINTAFLKSLTAPPLNFKLPKTTKTYISDFHLGQEAIDLFLGSSMHVFLLDLPRLEFAAIIPKGEFVTVCLLGENIDQKLIDAFFEDPEVRICFPAGWHPPANSCRCSPAISIDGAPTPYGDRIVFIGDAGVNRLYKDGIGGSYRTAKAAARTAIFTGVSAAAFADSFEPVCRKLSRDNAIGRIIFLVTKVIQKVSVARQAVLAMTFREQSHPEKEARMSGVLWDTFTGSAPYTDVFLRTLHPVFLLRLFYSALSGVIPQLQKEHCVSGRSVMKMGELGKTYKQGEILFTEGEAGDAMFVVLSGTVEVVKGTGDGEVRLAEFGSGEIFGEMAMFGRNKRSATVRAVGETRVITIDRKMFMEKIHQDPSLAMRIMEKMSERIRTLNDSLTSAASSRQQT
ncbi:MAG TPA: cyclic nucleotide-binding domain-containing protein [Desulfuromonadales bacterium]|nr:cyclic nucleotide-binding domain-containing protein [Desulfuromonadales bacterium]